LTNNVPSSTRSLDVSSDLDFDRQQLARARTELRPLIEALADQAPALGKAVNDSNLQVRLLARNALEEMGNARNRLRRAAASIAGEAPPMSPMGDLFPQAPPAIKRQEQEPPPRSGDLEEDLLLKSLEKVVHDLAKGLQDPDPQARLAALDVLETMGKSAMPVGPAIVKALSDPNRFVRWSAARTLGKIAPAEAKQAVPILARLLRDPDLDLATAASVALARYGANAAGAVPALIQGIGATDAEMRIAVMRTLEMIGPSAAPAIPSLARALSDPDARARQMAGEVLGRFGSRGKGALPALRRALGDDNAEVRKAVSDAILAIELDRK
jgi:HEAT repeat protein